jgi:hypothetical protein
MAKKAALIEEEKDMHFSAAEAKTLNAAELSANKKLKALQSQLATPLHNVVIQDFY